MLIVHRARYQPIIITIIMTTEQTINRSAKTSGGLIGFTRNAGAYERWCLARHERAAFLDATFQQIDVSTNSNNSHKACSKAEIRTSEKEAKHLKTASDSFVNPFKASEACMDALYSVSLGQPADGT